MTSVDPMFVDPTVPLADLVLERVTVIREARLYAMRCSLAMAECAVAMTTVHLIADMAQGKRIRARRMRAIRRLTDATETLRDSLRHQRE